MSYGLEPKLQMVVNRHVGIKHRSSAKATSALDSCAISLAQDSLFLKGTFHISRSIRDLVTSKVPPPHSVCQWGGNFKTWSVLDIENSHKLEKLSVVHARCADGHPQPQH